MARLYGLFFQPQLSFPDVAMMMPIKDVDGQSPTLELTSDHVRTLTGYEFKIAGKITDKDGSVLSN